MSVAPPAPAAITSTRLFASAVAEVDAQAVVDEALAAGGVTLFGKSGCPFCKKTKKALLSIGVHPTVVELDEIDGGAKVQKKLEEITGKATVPNVWLDGKFIGGSEEVIAGVDGEAEGFASMFDGVEKGEIIVIEDEPKVPSKQAENALKVGDKVPDVGLWQGFPNDEKISLAGIGKDQNILVVGLPGAFTPT
jgi:glutaredoxin 3